MGNTKSGRHVVSLFTDASYCGSTQCGGWGAWCKSNRGTATTGGEILFITDSGFAELIAVSKGIGSAFDLNLLSHGDHLVVKTDCERVVRMFSSRSPQLKPNEEVVVREIMAALTEAEISVSVQHVKGHTNSKKGPKYWVNNTCDKMAKTYMQQARNKRYQKLCISEGMTATLGELLGEALSAKT